MKGTVLIIDRDRAFVEASQNALETYGCRVIVLEDADIEDIRSLHPSVILASIEQAKGSGFSLCNRLRNDLELSQIPIILLSIRTSAEAIRKHAEQPERANLYAQKPLSPQQVTRLVEEFLQELPPETEPKDQDAHEDPAISRNPTQGPSRPPQLPPQEKSKPTAAPSNSGVWPISHFRQAFGQTPAADVTPGTLSSAPLDVRVNHLRTLLKHFERREHIHEQLFKEMNHRGSELASRLAKVSADAKQLQDARLQVENQLIETEHNFRTFHDDVQKIFEEKDLEEQQLQTRLALAEKRVEQLDAVLSTVRKKQPEVQAEIKLLTNQLKDSLNKSREKDNRITELQEEQAQQAQQAQHQLETAQTLIAQGEAKAKERQQTIRGLEVESERLTSRLESEQAKLRKYESIAKSAQKEAHLSKTKSDEYRQEADSWLDKYLTLESQLSHDRTLRKELESQLSNERTLRKQLESQLKHERSLCEQLESQLSQDRTLRDQLQASAAELETEVEQAQLKTERTEQKLVSLDNQLKEITVHAGTLKQKLAAQETQATQQAQSLNQELTTARQELAAAQNELSNNQKELATLRKQSEAATTRSENLEKELKQLTAQTEREIQTEEKFIAELSLQLEEAQFESETLHKNHQKLQNERNEIQAQANHLRQKCSELEAQIQSTEGSASRAEELFQKQVNKMFVATETIQRLEAEIETYLSGFQKAEEKVERKEEIIIELQLQLDNAKLEYDKLKNRVETQKKPRPPLEPRASSKSTESAALTSAANSLFSDRPHASSSVVFAAPEDQNMVTNRINGSNHSTSTSSNGGLSAEFVSQKSVDHHSDVVIRLQKSDIIGVRLDEDDDVLVTEIANLHKLSD